MWKFVVLAAAMVACVAADSHATAMSEPPAVEMNDGDIDFFSPKTVTFDRHHMIKVNTRNMEKAAEANEGTSEDLKTQIAAKQTAANKMKQDIDNAASAMAAASSKLPGDIEKAESAIADSLVGGGSTAHQKIKANKFAKLVSDEKAALTKIIQEAFAGLSVPDTVLTKKTTDAIAASKKAQADVKKEAVTLAAELAAHEKCAADNLLYSAASKKCTPPPIAADKLLNKVTHRMFNNADGRDSGYISNRYIKFVKTQANSYIRVFYYDNMRVHGHTAHGIWNIMVCDANGNGCAHCNKPGRMNMNKWSGHQHNWWMNDHMGHTMMGMCQRSDNRVLGKGTYQLKVMLSNNRYDMYTGHNQQNSFSVDEVWLGTN